MPERTLPLAALRADLDTASAANAWTMNPDGVAGRALLMPTAAPYRLRLCQDQASRLRTRVRLLPHDWRDGDSAVRASVTIEDGSGQRVELWAGVLRSSHQSRWAQLKPAPPEGLAVEVTIPRDARVLELRLDKGPAGPRAVARGLWVEPALLVHDDVGSSPAVAEPAPGQTAAFRFSVLTPVHDPPLQMLREAVESVRAQTYTDWELCLVDDGSRDPEVIAALQRYAREDPRIHLHRHEQARGIAEATNAALELATGDFVALLDHDDWLTEDALARVAQRIGAEPDLDMVYSDEDILQDGRQVWIHLKPAWSPDTLRTNGYTCHLGVYRRSLVDEIGGFRTAFNGSQDVDMILRLTERTDRIAHIPEILYHWRAHAASTAGGDAKPYAYVAARNAIAAHLERAGLDAEVGYGPPGLYRVAHRVAPSMTVDLTLGVASADGLAEAAAGWVVQPHPGFHVVIAAPPTLHPQLAAALAEAGIGEDRLTLVEVAADAAPAAALAAAATAGSSAHLLLMQTPAIGITHDWLARLLGYSAQPGIAAAGPVVLARDGRIANAGVALPEGLALHLLHGTHSSMDHFFGYGTSVYNVAAVSGILATPRTTYATLDGLDPELRELALIDYCLRAAEGAGRTVIVPDARLRVTTADTTVNDLPALRQLRQRWSAAHTHDPYYNPSFRTDRGDFEPARS